MATSEQAFVSEEVSLSIEQPHDTQQQINDDSSEALELQQPNGLETKIDEQHLLDSSPQLEQPKMVEQTELVLHDPDQVEHKTDDQPLLELQPQLVEPKMMEMQPEQAQDEPVLHNPLSEIVLAPEESISQASILPIPAPNTLGIGEAHFGLTINNKLTSMNTKEGTPPNSSTVILTTPDEFQDDVMHRLGRANGNVFQRKPGIEGVHDGQIMVRLKKKRFIVIDYSINPEKVNVSLSSITSSRHVIIPPGAGREKCNSSECRKVGVPVLLYDSAPDEPSSLYLRSGLCFTCQRTLNEKRRTQRKRKGDDQHGNLKNMLPSPAGSLKSKNDYLSSLTTPRGGTKRVKINNQIINLSPDAIIIDGPPFPGAKLIGPSYGMPEIAKDIETEVKNSLLLHLNNLIGSLGTCDGNHMPIKAELDPTATTSENPSVAPNAEELAARIAASSGITLNDEATSAAVASTPQAKPIDNYNDHEIQSHYDSTMNSIKKCIYLLSQFKSALNINANVIKSTNTNMLPLLLAADNAQGDDKTKIKDQNSASMEIDGMKVAV